MYGTTSAGFAQHQGKHINRAPANSGRPRPPAYRSQRLTTSIFPTAPHVQQRPLTSNPWFEHMLSQVCLHPTAPQTHLYKVPLHCILLTARAQRQRVSAAFSAL